MKTVQIPFSDRFREPMLSGVKTMTSRTSWKGEVGDEFEAFGGRFRITERHVALLAEVANQWKKEGCVSREDFIEVWAAIHPRRKYAPLWKVKVHEFVRVK